MSKITKSKNWVFELYPESMNKDYIRVIQEEICVPMCFSPLHDKDVNDETGEKKKPHYHVLVMYDGNTTYKNIKENICDKLNGTIPLPCLSVRGTYRYHLHLDNPEKYQYDDRDRQFFCGFDRSKTEALTLTEVNKYIREIHSFINDNNILEYADLCNCFLENGEYQMYEIASSHTVFFTALLNSKRNKLKEVKKEN